VTSKPEELPTDRFVIKDRLGSGGMGVVYRAFDKQRGIDVALKALRHVDGATVYRFKKEFRTLADIAHPGLVTLHEMLAARDEWFFTMELVEGVSFLEHVRPYHHLAREDSASMRSQKTPEELNTATLPTRPSTAEPGLAPHRRYVMAAELRIPRLRAALRKLVEAVQVLHAHGKLHRDIKPSNVLVTATGRVVLCDFGLIAQAADEERSREATAVGTPSYMSPEQAANLPITEASDWYSVGAMLYEALTGRLPHHGTYEELIELKRTVVPDPPHEVNPEAPADLAELCEGLLRAKPNERPSAAEILDVVGVEESRIQTPAPVAVDRGGFVGREAELETLRAALDKTRLGESVAVFVHGPSGMGKTVLLQRFVREVTGHAGTVVLEGRCYERESVPYKALDTLVDALSSYLMNRPRDEVDEIMPRDIMQLSRLFPVLRRVKAVADPKVRSFEPPDPQESRRRGFAALRYLLKRLAELRPLVLWIDDLQWGDVDSAAFLADLIHHPSAPAVLLLVSYRSEDADTSPLLRSLLGSQSTGVPRQRRHLHVGALDETQSTRLVREVAGDQAISDERIASIVRETEGNPLFLTELARAGADAGPSATLADLLQQRVTRLSDDARALLTVTAVSGRPIPVVVASRAAGLKDETAALTSLRVDRMVRTRQAGGQHEIECYHDQIRQAAIWKLTGAELEECHRNLASALEESNRPDYQALVAHLLGAGDTEKAGLNAARAAVHAEKALAFDRAAHYYQLALDHLELPPVERRAMLTSMGDALTNAGNLHAAASAYLAATDGAERGESLELRRRAVEQLLRGGHLDDGIREAGALLRAVGMRLPKSSRSALISVALRRVWLKLRGLGFKEHKTEEVDRDVLRRIDICWSLSSGLSLVDPMLGTAFQMRHLLQALRAGEPHHVALALSLEVSFHAMAGGKAWARSHALAEQARELAERIDDPHALGLCTFTSGIAAYLTGHWDEADDRLRAGDEILRERCTGVTWEMSIGRNFHMATLLYKGEIRQLIRLVPMYLREALDRGDEFSASGLRSWRSNVAWLALDRPDEARRQAKAATIHLADTAFHLHHYYELLTHRQIDLYEGDGLGAWQRLGESWRALETSMLLRVQMIRIEMQFLRARCAFAAAAAGEDEAAMLEIAEVAAAKIEKEHMPWGDPHAPLIRGSIAARRGEDARAVELLRAAMEGFDAAGMSLLAAVCRRRLGERMGGDEGKSLVRAADSWMDSQGVVFAEQMVELYAPGLDRPR